VLIRLVNLKMNLKTFKLLAVLLLLAVVSCAAKNQAGFSSHFIKSYYGKNLDFVKADLDDPTAVRPNSCVYEYRSGKEQEQTAILFLALKSKPPDISIKRIQAVIYEFKGFSPRIKTVIEPFLLAKLQQTPPYRLQEYFAANRILFSIIWKQVKTSDEVVPEITLQGESISPLKGRILTRQERARFFLEHGFLNKLSEKNN